MIDVVEESEEVDAVLERRDALDEARVDGGGDVRVLLPGAGLRGGDAFLAAERVRAHVAARERRRRGADDRGDGEGADGSHDEGCCGGRERTRAE